MLKTGLRHVPWFCFIEILVASQRPIFAEGAASLWPSLEIAASSLRCPA